MHTTTFPCSHPRPLTPAEQQRLAKAAVEELRRIVEERAERKAEEAKR